MLEDYKRNPDWERPDDWPYEEDWDSPAWQDKMAEIEKQLQKKREKYGFVVCPKCETAHTCKTIWCRECEHKVQIDKED